jgi:hypothetical protein
VLHDVRVAWDHPEIKAHGPDLAVFFGVPEQRHWSTFDVAEEGARPVLVVEVTSPETRSIDLVDKLDEYDHTLSDHLDTARKRRRIRLRFGVRSSALALVLFRRTRHRPRRARRRALVRR